MAPQVLAVVNLKGGSSKTTTAAFVAHVLHERGERVILVDADPQGSALRWQEDADWPISVIGMPSTKLYRELPGVVGDRFGWVVIDTPPLEAQQGIVMSALRAATHVLVPVAPTPIEYERLAAVRDAVADVVPVRADGVAPQVAMLLTRTVAGALSTDEWREAMTDDGDWVLRGSVGRLERFSQSYGQAIHDASGTAYGDAVTELTGVRVPA